MKTVGVIGGLGPMATVYFLELMTKMTAADCDQKHIRSLTASIPDTPDRTAYILGKSKENPLPHLVKAGKQLAAAGADFIAIPCVTAQYFQQELEEQIEVPVLSLCRELAFYLKERNIFSTGLLATSGTLKSKVLQRELEKEGIQVLCPGEEQQEKIMSIIYEEIKKGKRPDVESFRQIGMAMTQQGAGRVILGCTELSLIKRDYELPDWYVDVLEVLARAVILKAGASLEMEKDYADKCTGIPGRNCKKTAG